MISFEVLFPSLLWAERQNAFFLFLIAALLGSIYTL